MLHKRKSHAFKKDIYLLGIDNQGQNVWLEAPSWDCGWYWGFGYVERYTNNSDPSKAKDINSHTHIDSEFKKNDKIDLNKGLAKTTYTKNEGKRLNDLFTTFYQLKKVAEKNKDDNNILSDLSLETTVFGNIRLKSTKNINEILIPLLTKEIISILDVKNLDIK